MLWSFFWRAALLTYPIWGGFIGLGLTFGLFPGGNARETAMLVVLLPALATPAPVWASKIGVFGKVLLTLALYVYAYVAFFVMRFGIACEFFKFGYGFG